MKHELLVEYGILMQERNSKLKMYICNNDIRTTSFIFAQQTISIYYTKRDTNFGFSMISSPQK